jgi:hypothetical protein
VNSSCNMCIPSVLLWYLDSRKDAVFWPSMYYSILLGMYNRPIWQHFRIEHYEHVTLNWSTWTLSRFLSWRNFPVPYKLQIHIWWQIQTRLYICKYYHTSEYRNNTQKQKTVPSFYIYTSWNTRRCSGFKIKWKNSSDMFVAGFWIVVRPNLYWIG